VNRELLAAVVAQPENEALRLVLADHLLDRADPRGELIIAQCRLEHSVDALERHRLQARVDELLKEHQEEWLAPLGVGPSHVTWRRGFVEHVSLRWVDLVASWDRLRRHCPLTHVRIYGLRDGHGDLEQILCFDWPETLGSLSLYGNKLAGGDVERIAGAPALRHLRALDLGLNNLEGDGGLDALAGSPHLTGLRRLVLFANRLGPEAGRALARARRHLEQLVLGQNRLADEGVAALATGELSGLRSLSLSRNGIGPRGAAVLSRAAFLGKLEALVLDSNPLGVEGAREIAGADLSALGRLGVGGAGLGPEGVDALSKARRAGQITDLDLGGNGLGNEGAEALSRSSAFPRLESLHIDHNGIEAAGIRALVGSPLLAGIGRLELGANPIGAAGVAEVARLENLHTLGVSSCQLGEEGCHALAGAPALASLRRLAIHANAIGNRGAKALIASPHLQGLAQLEVGPGNHLNNHGQKALRDHFGGRVRL
jgi:uncharacterized protein (TIGR02996 family)